MNTETTLNWENAPDILKPQEAAKIMRVGRNKIYEIANRKGFPKLVIGEKHFLIPKEALKQWINRESQITGYDDVEDLTAFI